MLGVSKLLFVVAFSSFVADLVVGLPPSLAPRLLNPLQSAFQCPINRTPDIARIERKKSARILGIIPRIVRDIVQNTPNFPCEDQNHALVNLLTNRPEGSII